MSSRGLRPHFRVAVTDLPADRPPHQRHRKRRGQRAGNRRAREQAEGADGRGALAECFSRFASAHNGPVENRDPAYWVDRALAHKGGGHLSADRGGDRRRRRHRLRQLLPGGKEARRLRSGLQAPGRERARLRSAA